MKKVIVFFSILAIIGFSIPANAQCQKEGHSCNGHTEMCKMTHPKLITPSTVKLLKENYIKENLELKDNQKDAFWKSYNKYQAALEQAKTDAKAAREKANIPCCKDAKAQLTDAQKVATYNIQLTKRQAELTAEQTFFKEISKNLTEAQIATYLGLEKSFNMELARLQGTPKEMHGQAYGEKMNRPQEMKCNAPGQFGGSEKKCEGDKKTDKCDMHPKTSEVEQPKK